MATHERTVSLIYVSFRNRRLKKLRSMAKRKRDDMDVGVEAGLAGLADLREDLKVKLKAKEHAGGRHGDKKHTLDSDEEDDHDEGGTLDQDLIEGEEEATTTREGEISITPFNMKEEMEEGHFDTQGHYHWKKEKEIKDGWLDNIDWVKIQGRPEDKYKIDKDDELKGLGDESDSESDAEEAKTFNLISSYKEILGYMKPKETVQKCIQRLGAGTKISSAERWKRKKAGIVDPNVEVVTKITSVVNELLTKTGNMDVYQETFEKITSIIEKAEKSSKSVELDMYADDFDEKEKNQNSDTKPKDESSGSSKDAEESDESKLMWEFKWSQEDSAEVHGPHTTEQMQNWVTNGFFKKGVWVRKCGQEGPFYTSSRIDFELYI